MGNKMLQSLLLSQPRIRLDNGHKQVVVPPLQAADRLFKTGKYLL